MENEIEKLLDLFDNYRLMTKVDDEENYKSIKEEFVVRFKALIIRVTDEVIGEDTEKVGSNNDMTTDEYELIDIENSVRKWQRIKRDELLSK